MADCYYGQVASQYDSKREGTEGRRIERAAVTSLVEYGPVLDCPVGTGAFCDAYRDKDMVGVDISPEMLALCKRKHPWADLRQGDLLKGLPFDDGEFATAVCIRFFWWMPDGDMQKAFAELRRVSRCVVFSIRIAPTYGRPEYVPGKKQRRTLQHTKAQLTEALGGWQIDADVKVGGGYRVMRARL